MMQVKYKEQGSLENRRFSTNISLISKTVQDTVIVTIEDE